MQYAGHSAHTQPPSRTRQPSPPSLCGTQARVPRTADGFRPCPARLPNSCCFLTGSGRRRAVRSSASPRSCSPIEFVPREAPTLDLPSSDPIESGSLPQPVREPKACDTLKGSRAFQRSIIVVHRYSLGTVPSPAESPLGAALSGVEGTGPFVSSLVGAWVGWLLLLLLTRTRS